MIAVLCDESGNTLLGTDGYVHVDGRFTTENKIGQAREYRERFKKNFRHKYDHWTHVMFVQSIKALPTQYNHRTMPTRYAL